MFDVLSEQIVTSELLLRQCLSVFALPEMTFAWPTDRLPGTAVVFFCPGPQYFSFQRRERRVSEESLINLPHKASSVPVKCPLVLCADGHNE